MICVHLLFPKYTKKQSMSLANTKILIQEVPGDWTQRSQSGRTSIWNYQSTASDLPEVRLLPPAQGLYPELIDGSWWWVCSCQKCLGTNKLSYAFCEEHDRCITCQCTREQLTEAPWWVQGGWRCKPCANRIHQEHKEKALADAAAKGFTEDDCNYTDSILCPHCSSHQSSDDRHKSAKGMKCSVCDGLFDMEIEWTPSYTTTKATSPTTLEDAKPL